ncbi:MAG: LacI family DNA-binding transcriptional regulator [Longimicrobiales bacterium]
MADMRVTIRDVAREANVSIATVSRVLNESGPVRASTRERVTEVATRLRYSPSSAARSLITRQTRTLGVLLPDLYGEFFSELIRGIDRAARESGYHVLVSMSHNDRSELEAALQMMRGRVDGLIVMAPDREVDDLAATLTKPLPSVLLNQRSNGDAHDRITVDNEGGARALVGYLIGQGHRRIGLIGGPDANSDADGRRRGYRSALMGAGVAPRAELEVTSDFTEAGGFAAAAQLLRLADLPTAVFAANDAMAVGALNAFIDAGLAIPRDISLAGFDDIPMARYLHPSLTSVRVPIQELGYRATNRVVRRLSAADDDATWDEVLPTELVVRASCAAHRPIEREQRHA